MNQDERDLRELVESDKNSVIKLLEAQGLKVLGNEIEMQFSDGEIDESNLYKLQFKQLWELHYEPSLVSIRITINKPKELHSNITRILEILLGKITNRVELDSPTKNLDTSTSCPHFKLINIEKQKGNLKVKMYGAICYCS